MKEKKILEGFSIGGGRFKIPTLNGLWHGLYQCCHKNESIDSISPYKQHLWNGARIWFEY